MTSFYLSMCCDNCDEEIIDGPNITLESHRDLPVIPFDIAAQSRFVCPECGTVNYTGDL